MGDILDILDVFWNIWNEVCLAIYSVVSDCKSRKSVQPKLYSATKVFLLQCTALNTLRKVGRYIIQVRVFSSLLMQKCVRVCVCMEITHAFVCAFL